MNKELEELVLHRIEELKKPYEISPKYALVNKYVEEHSLDTFEDYLNLDMEPYITIRLYSELDISLEEAEDIAEKLSKTDYSDYRVLGVIFRVLPQLKKMKLDELFIEALATKNVIKSTKALTKLKLKNEDVYKNTMRIKALLKPTNTDPSLIEDLLKYGEVIADVADFATAQIEIIRDQEDLMIEHEKYKKEYGFIPNKLNKKITQKILQSVKDKAKVNVILQELRKPREFVAEEDKKRNRYNKANKKELESLQTAVKMLDSAISNGEVTNAEDIASNIKDENIKHKALEVIYNHNLKISNDVQDEYDSLIENNEVKYSALFNKYNLNINSEMVKLYTKHKLEDLEEMLKLLTNLNLKDKEILDILLKTDINTFNSLKGYLDRGIISSEFLEYYINIFDKSSIVYQNLESNIAELESLDINANIFFEQQYLLVADNELVKKNLEILKRYFYSQYIKSSKEFDFITASNLEERIDMLLELGYEKEIEKQMDLLNFDNFERLVLLKQMGLKPNPDELFNILNDEDFFIHGDITPYLQNIMEYRNDNDDIEKIPQEVLSPRVIKIGDSLVSKNKLERLLKEGKSLQEALFYNTYIDEKEYDALKIHSL